MPRRTSKLRYAKEYAAFRQQLVRAREASGLTQREVGELLGRHWTYVSKVETGERRIDVVELAQFARVYYRPLSYFVPFLRRPRRRASS